MESEKIQLSDRSSGPGPARLLLVDDEPALLDIGTIYLERGGRYLVTTATSAGVAIDTLRNGSFDVVVSDYQMPGGDGLALLREIRALYPDLPFILFTGKGREEVAVRAMQDGADSYVRKGGDTRMQYAALIHQIECGIERRGTVVGRGVLSPD